MYDVTSIPSFHKIEELKNFILSLRSELIKLPILIIGNKKDCFLERQIETHEGEFIAKKLGCSFLEISVKENNDLLHTILTPFIKNILKQFFINIHESNFEFNKIFQLNNFFYSQKYRKTRYPIYSKKKI